jgi:hypothetical protein
MCNLGIGFLDLSEFGLLPAKKKKKRKVPVLDIRGSM